MGVVDKSVDYAYPYGRVSGMHSKLLSKREIISYVQAVDVDEIIASLENTGYGVQLEGMPEDFVLLDVERALAENFIETYREVTSLIPKEDKIILDDYSLGVFDLEDIKTILRGLLRSMPSKKILELTSSWGRMGKEKLIELSQSQDLNDFISRLDEPYHSALKIGFPEYESTGDPTFLEAQLDAEYLRGLGGVGEIGDYIRFKMECLNLVNLLRCRLAGVSPKKYLLDASFHLTEKKLSDMVRMEPENILGALSKTFYVKAIGDLPKDSGMLWGLEKNLLKIQLSMLNEKAIKNPLSIWSVMSFVEHKMREVDKIRAIVVLKYRGFAPDEISGVLT